MKAYIRYTNHTDRVANDMVAITDIRHYLGDEKFTLLWNVLRQTRAEGASLARLCRQAQFLLAMTGVAGYPVRAYCRGILRAMR